MLYIFANYFGVWVVILEIISQLALVRNASSGSIPIIVETKDLTEFHSGYSIN